MLVLVGAGGRAVSVPLLALLVAVDVATVGQVLSSKQYCWRTYPRMHESPVRSTGTPLYVKMCWVYSVVPWQDSLVPIPGSPLIAEGLGYPYYGVLTGSMGHSPNAPSLEDWSTV